MDTPETIGARIGYIRAQLAISQADLGKALGLGRVSITRWESGTRTPRRIDLLRLADILGIQPLWLVEGVGTVPEFTLNMRGLLLNGAQEGLKGKGDLGGPNTVHRGAKPGSSPNGSEESLDPTLTLMTYEWRVRYTLERYKVLPKVAGIDPQLLHAFASGKALPSMAVLPDLARALSVPVEWFLTGVHSNFPDQMWLPPVPAAKVP